ncbi:hypothetical protein PVAP13_9NG640633, partial [Panicum virgatum]
RRQRSANAAVTRRARDRCSVLRPGRGGIRRAATSEGSWRPRGARVNKPFFPVPPRCCDSVLDSIQFCCGKQLRRQEGACLPENPPGPRAVARPRGQVHAHPPGSLRTPPPLRFALLPLHAAYLYSPPASPGKASEQQPAEAAAEARRQECECENEADRAERRVRWAPGPPGGTTCGCQPIRSPGQRYVRTTAISAPVP